MNTDNENFGKIIHTLVEHANLILKLTSEEIKEKLPDYSIKQLDYTRRNKLEESLEIRFENESCTFHCEFDKEWNCSAVYLFFDFNLEAYDYKTFLNNRYKYQWFWKRWKTQDKYYLKIIKHEDLICFKCYER